MILNERSAQAWNWDRNRRGVFVFQNQPEQSDSTANSETWGYYIVF